MVAELQVPHHHQPDSCASSLHRLGQAGTSSPSSSHAVVPERARQISSCSHTHVKDTLPSDAADGLGLGERDKAPAPVRGLQVSFHAEHPLVGPGYQPICRAKLHQQLSGGVSLSGAVSFGPQQAQGPAHLTRVWQPSSVMRDRFKEGFAGPEQNPEAEQRSSCNGNHSSSHIDDSSSSSSSSSTVCSQSPPQRSEASTLMSPHRCMQQCSMGMKGPRLDRSNGTGLASGNMAPAHRQEPCEGTSHIHWPMDSSQTAHGGGIGQPITHGHANQTSQAACQPCRTVRSRGIHQQGNVGTWHVEGRKRIEGSRTLVLRAEGRSKGPWGPQLVKLSWHGSWRGSCGKGLEQAPASAWLCVHRARGQAPLLPRHRACVHPP